MPVLELAAGQWNFSTWMGGGAPVDEVVAEVLQLAQAREIDAITGWHISSIRKKLEPLLNGKIPLKVACEGLHS